nr:MAG TPA: hypothetical protein [Bacteriophage sp.]
MEKRVINFFNRSSKCILNYLGRMNEYFEYDNLSDSINQFYSIAPKLSRYVDGVDPKLFFVDKNLEDQDEFYRDYLCDYIGFIGRIFYKYTNTIFLKRYDSLKELIEILNEVSRMDPERLDKSIVCTPDQFKDIRKEYLENCKVNLSDILKKDYSTKIPKVDSIWI